MHQSNDFLWFYTKKTDVHSISHIFYYLNINATPVNLFMGCCLKSIFDNQFSLSECVYFVLIEVG